MSTRADEGQGERVGRYVIDAWLASGGMADVYRARAHGAAGVVKELAIKRVSAKVLDSPRAIERFVAEARLSMQLSHANIVAVFDFGRADDGYYLAMEWIDGIDLAALVGRVGDPTPLPLGVVAYVGSEVARALQCAHEQGSGAIVHRDVKPSNVLLSRSGDVKLGDFGVAITVGDERTIAGTHGYMAPEQARGEPVDVRHDIYGLGKVLLEIGVGFRVDDADVPARLLDLDPDLAAIVRPMLAHDPATRTASAQGVASALERLASHAIARGDGSPRDELSKLVANAIARRSPSSESKSHPAGLHSFAHHETIAAVELASASITRDLDAPPPSTTESDTAPEAASSSRKMRITVLAALVVLVSIAFLSWRRPREDVAPEPRVQHAPPQASDVPHTPSETAPVVPPASPSVVMDAGVHARSAAPRVAPDRERPTPRAPEPAATTSVETTSVVPEARGTGLLNIAARPWANVFVDGRAAGVTPVMGLSVAAGQHRIRFENDALGASRTVTVDVPADGLRNVSVVLE